MPKIKPNIISCLISSVKSACILENLIKYLDKKNPLHFFDTKISYNLIYGGKFDLKM